MNIQPITEGNYFHIYSRGVNGENIFKEQRNYYYFLQQYKEYCTDVFETLAYALLKNHFHLLVYVKEDIEVPKYNGTGTIKLMLPNNYLISLILMHSQLIKHTKEQGRYLNRRLKENWLMRTAI